MFLPMNLFGEGGVIIPLVHRDSGLSQDRSSIQFSGHEMHAATSDLHSGGQGLSDPIKTFEAR